MNKTNKTQILLCILMVTGLFACQQETADDKTDKKLAMELINSNLPLEEKIDSLISLMTLDEKLGMIHAAAPFTNAGVERLGIPPIVTSDGPHGIRFEFDEQWKPQNTNMDHAVSYMPVIVGLAASWNPELARLYGTVLGNEAKARGKDVILAPGINIHRTPLCGRNYEYMSEDPYLVSKMVIPFIKGVQEQDVAACVKHFVVNNQEIERSSINVEVDERTLREIYLPGFEAAVKQGEAYTLMGAYNKFRGQYCSHNDYLLNKILKDEWEFDGVVISDWNATHDTKQAVNNGLDLEMGTEFHVGNGNYDKFYMANPLKKEIENGNIAEEKIDEKVGRILRMMFRIGMFRDDRNKGEKNTEKHQTATRKIAEETIVLLKNDGDILPLEKEKIKSIAVIGDNAKRKHAVGGGAAEVLALYEVTPLEGLKNAVGDDIELQFAQGYIADTTKTNEEMIAEAVEKAGNADVAIIFGGLIHGFTTDFKDNAYDAEAVDKPNLKLPFGQNELIEAVTKANPNTILVLISGGPVEMPWINQIPAIVQAWYPGMEGGNVVADVLFGKVNPSGKLPMTFPMKLKDTPVQVYGEYPGKNGTVKYNEGIMVGYRYYDTKNVDPLFPFGYGLSYTTFIYTDLEITPDTLTREQEIKIKLMVKNVGKRTGSEIVQLYVSDLESSIERPKQELKGFAKIKLEPGETKPVEFTLNSNDLKFYDADTAGWKAENGEFKVQVGSSSRNIRLSDTFELK